MANFRPLTMRKILLSYFSHCIFIIQFRPVNSWNPLDDVMSLNLYKRSMVFESAVLPEVYLEPSRISLMENFCENSNGKSG